MYGRGGPETYPPAVARPRRTLNPSTLVLVTGLVWGSAGIGAKELTGRGIDPWLLTAIPFLIGALLVVATSGRAGNSAASLGQGVALGVVATAGPTALFNLAFRYLPLGITTLVISLAPVVTNVTAHFVFPDERFNRGKAVGLTVAVLGAALLASAAPADIPDRPALGLGLVFAGAVLAGVTGVLPRILAVRWGARRLIGPQLLGAGLAPAVVGLALGDPGSLGSIGLDGWAILVWIGVLAEYVGFRSILAVNERATASQASVVGYVVPFVGVVGGALVFGERIGATVIAGGALILVGVAVVGRATSKRVLAAGAPG